MSRSEYQTSQAIRSSAATGLCKQLSVLCQADSNGISSTLYCLVSLPSDHVSSYFISSYSNSTSISHSIRSLPLQREQLDSVQLKNAVCALGLPVDPAEEKVIDAEHRSKTSVVGNVHLEEFDGSLVIVSRGDTTLREDDKEKLEFLVIVNIVTEFRGRQLPRFCNMVTIPLPLCRNCSLMLSLPSPSKLEDGWDLSIHPSLRSARSFADDESDLEWTEGSFSSKESLTIRWTGRGTGEDGALTVKRSDLSIDCKVDETEVKVIVTGQCDVEYAGMREKGWIEVEIDQHGIGYWNVEGVGVVGSETSTSPRQSSPTMSKCTLFSPISSDRYPPSPSQPRIRVHELPFQVLRSKTSFSSFTSRIPSFSSLFGEISPPTPSDVDLFDMIAPENPIELNGPDAFETDEQLGYPPSLLRMTPPFTSTIGEPSMISYESELDDSISSDTEFSMSGHTTLFKIYLDLSTIITSSTPVVNFVLSFSLPLSFIESSVSHSSSQTIGIPPILLRATGAEEVLTTVSASGGSTMTTFSFLDGVEDTSPLPAQDGIAKWATSKQLGAGEIRDRKKVELLVSRAKVESQSHDHGIQTPLIDSAVQTSQTRSAPATSTMKITTIDKAVNHRLDGLMVDSSTATIAFAAVASIPSTPLASLTKSPSRFSSPFVTQLFVMIILAILAYHFDSIQRKIFDYVRHSSLHYRNANYFSLPARTIMSLRRSSRPTFPPQQYSPRLRYIRHDQWVRLDGIVWKYIRTIPEYWIKFDWGDNLRDLVAKVNAYVGG